MNGKIYIENKMRRIFVVAENVNQNRLFEIKSQPRLRSYSISLLYNLLKFILNDNHVSHDSSSFHVGCALFLPLLLALKSQGCW